MINRHPYPVQRARDRIARSVDRLLLILAAITISAMIGGVL